MASRGARNASPGATPRRGRPPRISQDQIIAAAKSLAPKQVTMQAVADVLAVDRSALNYYVGDRDGLLEILVTDLFDTQLRGVDLPDEAWQEVVAAYGRAIREGAISIGASVAYVSFRGAGGEASLALAERVLSTLLSVGFTVEQATGVLTMVSVLALASARDELTAASQDKPAQLPEVVAGLSRLPDDKFPAMREAITHTSGPTREFDFELEVVINGLERLLTRADLAEP